LEEKGGGEKKAFSHSKKKGRKKKLAISQWFGSGGEGKKGLFLSCAEKKKKGPLTHLCRPWLAQARGEWEKKESDVRSAFDHLRRRRGPGR